MNDQTAKLLEQLACKLGTTTEYLWGVLLKQAPIDATVTLIQTICILLFGWVLFKIHKKLISPIKEEKYSSSYYDEYDVYAKIPMLIACIIWFIMFGVSFFAIDSIIYGFFNPEYWALKELLRAINSSK